MSDHIRRFRNWSHIFTHIFHREYTPKTWVNKAGRQKGYTRNAIASIETWSLQSSAIYNMRPTQKVCSWMHCISRSDNHPWERKKGTKCQNPLFIIKLGYRSCASNDNCARDDMLINFWHLASHGIIFFNTVTI